MTQKIANYFLLVVFFITAVSMSSPVSASEANLIDAVRNGDLTEVRSMFATGADVNFKRIDGTTALIWASTFGNADIVRELLNKGADINVKDEYGKTALDAASLLGHTVIVKLLKGQGAEPTIPTGMEPVKAADNINVVFSESTDSNSTLEELLIDAMRRFSRELSPKVKIYAAFFSTRPGSCFSGLR